MSDSRFSCAAPGAGAGSSRTATRYPPRSSTRTGGSGTAGRWLVCGSGPDDVAAGTSLGEGASTSDRAASQSSGEGGEAVTGGGTGGRSSSGRRTSWYVVAGGGSGADSHAGEDS